MKEQELYRIAYNAHEAAENAAHEAMRAELAKHSIEALSCLADPEWGWENRGWMSAGIIDSADDLLTDKLNAALGFQGVAVMLEP